MMAWIDWHTFKEQFVLQYTKVVLTNRGVDYFVQEVEKVYHQIH